MNLFRWAESKIKTLTIWDMSFVKICCIAFALMIAKLVPAVLTLEWYWYGLVFVVTYAWILMRLFKKPAT